MLPRGSPRVYIGPDTRAFHDIALTVDLLFTQEVLAHVPVYTGQQYLFNV